MPFITAILTATLWFYAARALKLPFIVQTPNDYTVQDVKVPLTLGVMSQCPDALLCESVIDRTLQHVRDKVDLSLTFIGRLNASEPDFGVTCKHGPTECRGNVQELCAIKYTPASVWWRFVQCQNFQGRWKVGEPDIALNCAKSSGIDWENSGVGECVGLDASGTAPEGVDLLKESILQTEEMGIVKSCTILINDKPVCIHDETWKECENGHRVEDFVRQINEEYARLNSQERM
ncbi:hypothetical protein BDY19DRAFT_990816 [Irpex rosettiformis]|uniref:Uncharacterized protein n=1 Tax=Irpex rosettiformis TaxID=378272 RepID=A0ACB8UCR3_9APHY|nr:hypothetical protein BDY19DRAFT_990816 [Irpex rosettiformis]